MRGRAAVIRLRPRCAMLAPNWTLPADSVAEGVDLRMGRLDREVLIGTGRRAGDGSLRLSVFAEDLLALTVEGRGERAPTLLLTRAQIEELRAALDAFVPLIAETPEGQEQPGAWRGAERRQSPGAG